MLQIEYFSASTKVIQNKLQKERIYRFLFRGCLLLTAIVLALITIYIFWNGLKVFTKISPLEFFTGLQWEPVVKKKFGILPMIITSLYITFASLLLSLPLGLGCAIFTAETKHQRIKDLMQSAIAVLAGIPSVVYGLIGLSLLVPWIQTLGNSAGYSMLAAILILAVMILPTIMSISQDAIEAVPNELREASFALGGTRIQTILKVILPIAKPGIVAAVVLSISRAFGEAMAIKMIIGNTQTIPDFSPETFFGLLSPARALTTNIIGDIEYAQPGAHLEALFATGAVLFVVTLLVNYLAYLSINKTIKAKRRQK